MFKLSQLGGHQDICLFWKVLCPGSGATCKLQLAFNKVKEHLKDCPSTWKKVSDNHASWVKESRDSDKLCFWKTKAISAHDRTFFVKHKKENSNHYFETLMLGSEEESMGYQVSLTIQQPGQNKSSKHLARHVFYPRPIDLQSWGVMGLTLPEKALSKIAIREYEIYQFSLAVSVEKL